MGFIPIFITLGGFVFLFILLVNHNMNRKKSVYYAKCFELAEMLAIPAPQNSGNIQPGFEEHAKEYLASKGEGLDHQSKRKIKTLVADIKRARFQYHNLKNTKPYYYVGKLFGHVDL